MMAVFKVVKTVVSSPATDGIEALFDRPMVYTNDAFLAISAIVNGGTPIVPTSIVSNPSDPSELAFLFTGTTFKAGDVITWSYNDQHPTGEIKGAETGGVEIDNQTYTVKNEITANTNDWADESSDNWVDENNNTWEA